MLQQQWMTETEQFHSYKVEIIKTGGQDMNYNIRYKDHFTLLLCDSAFVNNNIVLI